ncbi:hypothetical protein [Streptomyces sp. NPDC047108]|uniref:hypothetical protein n=1 Tax=Streptomyces sp. NPDC047108 TaxID=3155025 RepID=UPI0033C80688
MINKTRGGRIEWAHEGGEDPWAAQSQPDTFSISLTRGTAAIWSVDGDHMHPYVFQVRGDRGQVVEQIETTRPFEDQAGWDSMETDIQELYEAARRNALNIDSVLRQMLEDLDDK